MAFTGWPVEAFEFYADLEADNSKAFWTAHRDVYERAVKGPFVALGAEVADDFGALKLFRPNRDVRFSNDKSPYKTAAGAFAQSEGGGGFYVQVSADELFIGCGMYAMASDQLERWRVALDDNRRGGAIAKIADGLRADGYDIAAMDALKTAPRGYAKDHPRVELLRLKGLTMGKAFGRAKWMHTPKAKDRILEVWRAALPMNRWLDRNVGPSHLPPR